MTESWLRAFGPRLSGSIKEQHSKAGGTTSLRKCDTSNKNKNQLLLAYNLKICIKKIPHILVHVS
jgi:hypothetical protein